MRRTGIFMSFCMMRHRDRRAAPADRKTAHRHTAGVLVCSAAVLVLLCFASVRFGSADMTFTACVHALSGDAGYETERVILLSVRLPRMAAGVLAGAGLSLSGLLLQTVTDNALAGPNIIGVNAGAGFACAALLSFAPGIAATLVGLPFAAFAGAFCTTLFILLLSGAVTKNGNAGDSSGMDSGRTGVILAGVAVTALLNAAVSFLTLLDTDVLSSYNAFSVGGFSGVRMTQLSVPAAVIGFCLLLALLFAPQTEILCIGDRAAALLGIRVRRLRLLCILCASACAAAVVSFAGLLGFVGLIVPHMARRISSLHGGRALTVLCVLLGGCVTLAADLAGRLLLSPTEIPVGIMMAFVGVPYFLYLLRKGKG